MRSVSRRPSMRPCVRNALVIARASAGVGTSTGRMFHSARVPRVRWRIFYVQRVVTIR